MVKTRGAKRVLQGLLRESVFRFFLRDRMLAPFLSNSDIFALSLCCKRWREFQSHFEDIHTGSEAVLIALSTGACPGVRYVNLLTHARPYSFVDRSRPRRSLLRSSHSWPRVPLSLDHLGDEERRRFLLRGLVRSCTKLKGLACVRLGMDFPYTEQEMHSCQVGIQDTGTEVLAEALMEEGSTRSLQVLNLTVNNITSRGAKALSKMIAKGITKELRWLRLGMNKLGDEGVIALAEALGQGACPNLFFLDMPLVYATPEGLKALAVALVKGKYTSLSGLSIGLNPLDLDAVNAWSDVIIKNPRLELLGLSYCGFGSDGLRIFVKKLVESGATFAISRMHLIGNMLEDEGVVELAKALPVLHQLTFLDVSKNEMGCQGVAALIGSFRNSLCNQCLKGLLLCGNPIENEGAALLADALDQGLWPSLERLSFTEKSGWGFEKLTEAIKARHMLMG